MTLNPLMQDYVDFWRARLTLKSDRPEIGELLKHKFTNAYRICDRSSQTSYRDVITGLRFSQNIEEILFRVFFHVHFHNSSPFAIAAIAYGLNLKEYGHEDFYRFLQNTPGLWSNAYSILPLPGDKNKLLSICRKAAILKAAIDKNQINFRSTESLFESLASLQGMGNFLSSQIIFNMEWAIHSYYQKPLYKLGIGAERGAWKLGLNHLAPKASLMALQGIWEEHLSQYFLQINGISVAPHPADLQNTLCEADKMLRVLHPSVTKKGYPTSPKLKPYTSRGGADSFAHSYPSFFV